MKASRLRVFSWSIAFGLAMVACGGRSAPLPTAPGASPVAVATSDLSMVPGSGAVATLPASDSPDSLAYAESFGALPDGFVPAFRVTPRPDADGVIRGESPLKVEFDLCGSTADAGKALHFLYDWDFNHVADLVGTGTACHQAHTYRVSAQENATGVKTIRTNVCVANGDPRGETSGVFFACRAYTFAIPIPQKRAIETLANCIVTFGGAFTECLKGRTLSQDAGNDGSFENSWFIQRDSTNGPGGNCPGGTTYIGDVSVNSSQTDFIAFLESRGIKLTDDYCHIP